MESPAVPSNPKDRNTSGFLAAPGRLIVRVIPQEGEVERSGLAIPRCDGGPEFHAAEVLHIGQAVRPGQTNYLPAPDGSGAVSQHVPVEAGDIVLVSKYGLATLDHQEGYAIVAVEDVLAIKVRD